MQQIVFTGLQRIPSFSSWPKEALLNLAAIAKTVHFAKGDRILYEGETSHALYIVLSGKVKVLTQSAQQPAVDLLILEAGWYFGELALLSNEPRAATVTATEKTVCGVISQADFKHWLKAHPGLEINPLSLLAEKVSYLNEKTQQMALSSVYTQLVKVLQALAVEHAGELVIMSPPSVPELAASVGANADQVKQVLKALLEGGYILKRGKIWVLERDFPEHW